VFENLQDKKLTNDQALAVDSWLFFLLGFHALMSHLRKFMSPFWSNEALHFRKNELQYGIDPQPLFAGKVQIVFPGTAGHPLNAGHCQSKSGCQGLQPYPAASL
jgi:hypothetical protein